MSQEGYGDDGGDGECYANAMLMLCYGQECYGDDDDDDDDDHDDGNDDHDDDDDHDHVFLFCVKEELRRLSCEGTLMRGAVPIM